MSSKPPFIAQERSDTCMLACLRMLLAHRGIDVTETALGATTSVEEGGLDPDQLAQLAQNYGLNAEACQLDLAAIAAQVGEKRFPIVLVDRTPLDGEFSIHAVIPIHFTTHYVSILDPLHGERRVSIRKKGLRRLGSRIGVAPFRPVPSEHPADKKNGIWNKECTIRSKKEIVFIDAPMKSSGQPQ